jgi:hypothetical protein
VHFFALIVGAQHFSLLVLQHTVSAIFIRNVNCRRREGAAVGSQGAQIRIGR